jgi:uncharacterized protein YqjF (DUF2071 family)
VPFHMKGVGPRFLTWLPWVSAFVELNVRTYVTIDDRPGVWFFSLDASNPVAVRAARLAFHLPYFQARMLTARKNDWVYYKSLRTHHSAPPATLPGATAQQDLCTTRCPARSNIGLRSAIAFILPTGGAKSGAAR